MNSLTDQQLLRDYTERRSEAAFAELARRHVDLVYSAALRMVRDAHLTEDVTQGVFVALAQSARQLTDRPVLSGWLHRTAQNLASKAVRSEVRRRAHEQEAAAMNELLATESDATWESIAPHLDAALGELSDADRDAVLLRYFERKSAREMAQILGTSEDAAQKRVGRAVERLREFFAKRGVTVGASGLVAVISANAVQAAPVGLAATISTAAALAGTTITATATATSSKAIAMTTLQKTLVTTAVAVLAGAGIYEGRQASCLRDQVQTLQQQQAPLAEQLQQLTLAHDEATNQLAALREENERLNRNTAELVKLRGEVGRLRKDSQELTQIRTTLIPTKNDALDSALISWLDRAKLLKQLPEKWPDKAIPELQFLAEDDWLNCVRHNKLENETDLRRALSNLRETAKGKFAYKLGQALYSYAQLNNGQLPTDVSQLKPYFQLPVDDTLLQRYQLLHTGNMSDVPAKDPLAAEIASVDNDYDTLFKIGVGGYRYQGIGELHEESGMSSWSTNSFANKVGAINK